MLENDIIDLEELVKRIVEAAAESISEEDLRIRVEHILQELVIKRVGGAAKEEIPLAAWRPPKARYEVTLVSGVRLDALYGHLIIEYEKPRAFESRSSFERAVEQVKQYIRDHAKIETRYPKYFGVVMDGYRIGFVRYREALKGFEGKGPFEINKNTVAKLVEAIIGLRKKALNPEELLKDFGPENSTAKEAINTIYTKLLRASPKTKVLFDDWKRVFSQVCAYSPEKIKDIGDFYGFGKNRLDSERLLFALHTYYALIMKLLAAEVASLYLAPKIWSYLRTLEDAYYRGHEELRDRLKDLEEGGVFASLGITNFMEADYFAWYLDDWDEDIAKSVMRIVNTLSNYDPTSAELEPERVRDLFKRLYQNLVPKKIRHDLGEYYTPDWLAELVLNEVGWTLQTFEDVAREKNDTLAPLELRLLDPACGSGTFLVLAISRLRSYVEEHWVDKGAALRRIVKNVIGFDLNPLAVIASRANYLIALGDMLRERGAESIEIPVYLADSILVERRQTLTGTGMWTVCILKTAAGEFSVPTSVVEKGLLSKALTIIEESVKGGYTVNECRVRLLREMNLEDSEVTVLAELFKKLSTLEKEGRNRIWARILKNSFAPFFTGRFDYVVGNPPWINWESLPQDYRKSSENLWSRYGLLEKTKGMGLGKVKRDISTLFLAACFDRYLVEGGNLSFLMPFTVLKTHASAGFRKFLSLKGTVIKIHDTVELFPFEGAINRTCIIYVKKSGKTEFPIPCVMWRKPTKMEIPVDAGIEYVTSSCEQYNVLLAPTKKTNLGSPWMIATEKAYKVLQKVMKPADYRAYAGVYTGLDGTYYISIILKQGDDLLIQNMHETGKKKLKQIQSVIESQLVYPLVRGRDVKRWSFDYSNYVIVPTDENGENIPPHKMKVDYPKTYAYFLNFEKLLKERSVYKLVGKNHPAWYGLFIDIGEYTFSRYKVIWKNVSGKISGKAEFSAAVIGPVKDKFLGEKIIIPNVKLMFIPLDNEDEAHYICAILNSSIVRLIVASYVIETGISTHILQNVSVPVFNKKDKNHIELSNLSKRAHQLTRQNCEEELRKVESEIDKLVAQIYGITEEELDEVKRCLAILEGKVVGPEESTETPEAIPDIFVENPVLYWGPQQELELTLVNPYEEPLENVKVKLELGRTLFEEMFDKLMGEHRLKIPLHRLGVGEHRARVSLEYTRSGSVSKTEKEIPIYVKDSAESFAKRGGLEDILGDAV